MELVLCSGEAQSYTTLVLQPTLEDLDEQATMSHKEWRLYCHQLDEDVE